VARQLRELGFDAAALKGGYNAWRAKYPIESKQPIATPHMATDSSDGSPELITGELEPQAVAPTGDNNGV
jgi:hypothetical protein